MGVQEGVRVYNGRMDKEDDKKIIHDTNAWMNEHARPSYEALVDLAHSETPEAYEILRELALKYNIDHDDSTPLLELAAKISNMVGKTPDENSY